ncbi:MAG TPA: DNA-binding protein, partial [Chlorobaculum parvum]|nr:DNA-binding protein [Chlorobaculum parvum]
MSKKALGKGLKALITEEGFAAAEKAEEQESVKDGAIGSLPVEKIKVN